jgi:hypothetical protein
VTSKVGWAAAAFGPALLLLLPNCSFNPSGQAANPPNLDPGPEPRTEAVFCDIEKRSEPRRCATPTDLAVGVRMASAAMALVRSQSSAIGLDYSPAALAACAGQPQVVTFEGPFPDGSKICLNCGAAAPAATTDRCVAKCLDILNEDSSVAVPPDVLAFCQANARPSTNASSCFMGVCTPAGAPDMAFVDPRRTPEPVVWINLNGVVAGGPNNNTLTKTAPDLMAFDSGAVSQQLITQGDGYVECTAAQLNVARICGLSSGPSVTDTTTTDADIDFGLRLTVMGNVLVEESGVLVESSPGDPIWGTYAPGDRVRVSVRDNFDGTANVTYSIITGPCPMGTCDGTPVRTVGPAPYPFHADTSFKETGGDLTDVRIVRIQQ